MRHIGLAFLLLLVTATGAFAMSRSQAGQIARSSNLKAGDMSGYTADSSGLKRSADLWGGRRYAMCVGRQNLGRSLADLMSPTFQRTVPGQYQAIGSEVMVEPNESFAAKDIKLAKSSLGQRCIKREMLRFKPKNVTLENFGASRLGGFNNGVAYRIKMTVTSRDGLQVPIYVDLFAFSEREVEGAVFFVAGPKPPDRSTENHFVDLVQSRIDKQVYKNDIV